MNVIQNDRLILSNKIHELLPRNLTFAVIHGF